MKNVMSSSGIVRREVITVNGKEYRIEGDLEKTWIQVIDDQSRCASFKKFNEADGFVFESGEDVCEDWNDADWQKFEAITK